MDHRPWPVTDDAVELNPVPVGLEDQQLRRALQMMNVLIEQFNALVGQVADIVADYLIQSDLDTFTGTAYIATVGTIETGTWQGTAIADDYIASAGVWSAKQDALVFNTYSVLGDPETGVVGLQGDLVAPEARAFYGTNAAASRGWYFFNSLDTVGTITTGTWQATVIDHERGGLEADISAYDGLVKISGGATSAVSLPLAHEVGGLEADISAYDGLVHITGGSTSAISPANSIEIDTGNLQLDGDSASPGNDKLYGTNATGVKGWYDKGGTYTFSDSLAESGGTVNLVGDETSPGNGKLYGTDSAGNKQWLDVAGTANEITVTVNGDGVTFSLPDDVTIGDDLTVAGNISVVGPATFSGGIIFNY